MEAEQRRAVALAQRQKRIQPQAPGLLIAEIGSQQRAQFAHRRGHHHLPRGHLPRQLAAELCRQTHRQQRMTAEGEEIGVDIVHLAAQQLAEGRGDKGFHPGLRRPAAALPAEGRQRQRFAVQFAVGAKRQLSELHQHHRHHMRRQLFRQPRFQRRGIQRQAGVRDQIAHQLSGIAAGRRRLVEDAGVTHRLRHVRQARHHPVNLAKLDALPADLQLVVAAAKILHRAVRQPARHVAGAIHPLTGGKRVGDKAAGGEVRTSQIALRQLDAGEIKIPRHPRRHRAHRGIENAQPGVPHRPANRHAAAGHRRQLRPAGRIPADVHRRLRRAVQVMQRRAGQALPLAAQFRRQRFAAAEYPPQRAAGSDAVGIQRGDKRRQHRRHKVGGGHAVAGEELLHRLRVAVRLRLGHHQLRAGDKRPPELPHRHVETARRFLRHHVLGR